MTEREQIKIAELKLSKAEQQDNRCTMCGKKLPSDAQLSHKIGKGSRNIAHYEREYSRLWGKGIGKKIIHHPFNMDLTCPGECNTLTAIDSKNALVAELVEKILEDIKNE